MYSTGNVIVKLTSIDVDCRFLTPIDQRQHDVKSHFGVVIDFNRHDASEMMFFDVFRQFLTISDDFQNFKK